MQIGTTYNSLVWENPENLPFPEEVKPLLKTVKLDELKWNASGLPIHGAEYSISSNELYFIEAPDGQVQVEKIEFTGQFLMGAVFLDEGAEQQSYFITFLITLCKGEVVEIKLNKTEPIRTQAYKDSLDKIDLGFKKKIKRQNSLLMICSI